MNNLPAIIVVLWGSVVLGMLYYICSKLSEIARNLRERR